MSDFSNYAEQGLQFGRTREYEVTELANPDGSHPLLDVEHIGAANATLIEEMIAGATAPAKEPAPVRLSETIRSNRDRVIKHAVRHLRNALFSDGTAATDAAIADFVNALPAKAFERLLVYVSDDRNFYKFPIAEKPAVLAEK